MQRAPKVKSANGRGGSDEISDVVYLGPMRPVRTRGLVRHNIQYLITAGAIPGNRPAMQRAPTVKSVRRTAATDARAKAAARGAQAKAARGAIVSLHGDFGGPWRQVFAVVASCCGKHSGFMELLGASWGHLGIKMPLKSIVARIGIVIGIGIVASILVTIGIIIGISIVASIVASIAAVVAAAELLLSYYY